MLYISSFCMAACIISTHTLLVRVEQQKIKWKKNTYNTSTRTIIGTRYDIKYECYVNVMIPRIMYGFTCVLTSNECMQFARTRTRIDLREQYTVVVQTKHVWDMMSKIIEYTTFCLYNNLAIAGPNRLAWGRVPLSTASHRRQSTSLAMMVPCECAISTTCNAVIQRSW